MSLLLTLNIFHTLPSVSIVNFEQLHANWDDRWKQRFLAIYQLKIDRDW